MNYQAIAAALHALADALVSQSSSPASTPAAAAVASTPAPVAAAAPKPRGRPPKGVEGAPATAAAQPAPAATVAPPAAVAAPTAPATANGLTHAQLVPAFKAAAVAHGAEFVRGLLKTHGAATFDKVKDLDTFAAQLKAGPVAAPAANAVDDLLG